MATESGAVRLVVTDCQEAVVPDREWFHGLLAAVAHVAGPVPSLSLALVDDARIGELHARFLGTPGPTDVMAFPLGDDEGEVVVSVETAAREASRLGCSLEEELALYVVHGVLHLMGHDDLVEEERSRMIAVEKEVLRRFGMTPKER